MSLKNFALQFIFLSFGYSLSAQTAFFIKPRIMMKTNQSLNFTDGFWRHNNQTNYVSNEYYTFVNNGHHFDNTKINLGISAGVQFNKKNTLELVLSADNSSVSSSFGYYQTQLIDGKLINSPTSGLFIWGRDVKRLYLEYNRLLFSKKNFALRGLIGFGVFIPHKRTEYFPSGIGNNKFSGNIDRINFNNFGVTPIYQIGFGIDFKTKRGVPIFSLDIFATLNKRSPVQMVQFDVTLLDLSDNSIHYFQHTLKSRGSGINFQLSRPIQFYPWRPNKKSKI
jgi:hypothetical protein